MKRIALTLVVVLIGFLASGQRFGLKAGANISNATFNIMGFDLSPDSRTGLHFGLVNEFQINNFLFLQPALLFSQKGYEVVFEETIGSEYFRLTGFDHFNYLDLPLNLVLKADLRGPKLLIFTGPVIGYALNGKTESNGDSEAYNDRGNIKFGSDDDAYDRFDFSVNLGAGVEFGNLQLTGNYAIGLSNLTHSDEISLKHRVLEISLAYFFDQ